MHIAQLIAAQAVGGVLNGRNLSITLLAALKAFPQATPQQKAGAQDLSYNTLRFYAEAAAYLKTLTETPITDEGIRNLLIVAIAQLLHGDNDDFTVVNQAVTAATHSKKPWAKGLVNGVLRNFLRQQEKLAPQILAKESAQFNYPQWWIDKLKNQYPSAWQHILQTGNQHPPMTLRVNVRKTNVQDYLKLLAQHGVAARALVGEDASATAVMLEKPLPVEKIPGFTDGLASIQDLGAQLAAHILNPSQGAKVLDACAAPGGKTCHMLELADIAMTALDSDEKRLHRVAENLTRLNLNAALKTGMAEHAHDLWPVGYFDFILADVPCSASGIVRRHVDMKWLRRAQDISSFAQQQVVILQQLWQCLASGGKLLYATCSVFHEENQAQIDAFLQRNADATQLPILLTNNFAHDLQIEHGQLIPNAIHDGLFYALLQKS